MTNNKKVYKRYILPNNTTFIIIFYTQNNLE